MSEDRFLYFDHAATTPVASEVRDVIAPLLSEGFGNPSSVHALGRRARAAVDSARDALAAVLGCAHGEVVFTAGGTEANNLALRGTVDRWPDRGRHLVITAVEHDSILATGEQLVHEGRAEVTTIGCDRLGRVDPGAVADAVRPDTLLVSTMLVNNEVGAVQDVAAIAQLAHQRNPRVVMHCDAVQALGKLPVRVDDLGVDLLSLSAHKVYGPKGAGALYVRRGTRMAAQLTGGGQERNRRSGTENVPAIAGFGAAADLAESRRATDAPRLEQLASRLTAGVVAALPDAVVTAPAGAAPGFACFAFAGVRTDLLLTVLDQAGLCASGGSACSSGAPVPSHVLDAMGLPAEVAGGALRCTAGRSTTEADVDLAVELIAAAVRQVRAGGR